MKTHRHRGVTLTTCVVLFVCAAAVHGQNYGDISVVSDPPFVGTYYHGYVEHRFNVVNRSFDREHVVRIDLPESSYGHGDHVRRISRTVSVSPGTAASVSLFAPSLNASGSSNAVVWIDGRRQRDGVFYNDSAYQGGRGSYSGVAGGRSVLISRGVGGTFRDGITRDVLPHATSRHWGGHAIDMIDAIDVASWSTYWLGYTRFAGVVMTADEFRRAPEAVRQSLWRYAESGGVLTVFGDIEPPRPWQSHQQHHPDVRHHHVGFGIALIVKGGTGVLQRWDQPTWQGLDTYWQQTASPLNETRDVGGMNSVFPVVDNLTLPVRSMLALMILFAVVIGPVNLFVLARKRRAVWMLWTIPTLSLATSAAVFGYAMVIEGWNAHSRVAAITLLDEVNQRATTLGTIGYYSPLTPADGLRFEAQTEVMPQVGSHWRQGGTGRTVDWTAGQHLQTGWVSARVPAFFKVRKSESRLERLQLTRREDGAVTAVNGLGVPLVELYVAGPDNRLLTARHVDAGASVTLSPHTSPQPNASELRNIFTGDWVASATREDCEQLVPPNGYVAVIEGSPFVEAGLTRLRSSRQRTIVIGIMKEPWDTTAR
jgi:hypothetical protein